MARNAEAAELIKNLRKQNFTVEITKASRAKVCSPSGEKICISLRPGDGRSYLNCVSRLRKIGYRTKI